MPEQSNNQAIKQPSTCIFCKIIKGEIPCYKIWEDENHLAFLDIFPIKPGHTMVIPKNHHPYAFEIPSGEYEAIWNATKIVSEILKKAFNPKTGKIGVVVYGLDVDHTHIHLVPLDKSGDLDFKNKYKATKEELENTLSIIKDNSN